MPLILQYVVVLYSICNSLLIDFHFLPLCAPLGAEMLHSLLIFSCTFWICFPHNEIIETAPWELIGEVNVLPSSTSIVALSKHLSYHLNGGTLCEVGLEWTDSCVMLMIARAHCEYSVDHNYRGLEKNDHCERQMGNMHQCVHTPPNSHILNSLQFLWITDFKCCEMKLSSLCFGNYGLPCRLSGEVRGVVGLGMCGGVGLELELNWKHQNKQKNRMYTEATIELNLNHIRRWRSFC